MHVHCLAAPWTALPAAQYAIAIAPYAGLGLEHRSVHLSRCGLGRPLKTLILKNLICLS